LLALVPAPHPTAALHGAQLLVAVALVAIAPPLVLAPAVRLILGSPARPVLVGRENIAPILVLSHHRVCLPLLQGWTPSTFVRAPCCIAHAPARERISRLLGRLPRPRASVIAASARGTPRAVTSARAAGDREARAQFAVEVASKERITVTLIWPGNVISS